MAYATFSEMVFGAWEFAHEDDTAQEEARKKQQQWEKLPETVAALQEDNKTLKKGNEMLKQCLLEMSEIVYA